ncbi:MAG: hypothetical protein CM1200mP41_12690 [Gammaproteobacteria bacterium]|nr:MAG: hypothetical protein CM1200mP41_12690 [Gammaproteobacteria bacterium]
MLGPCQIVGVEIDPIHLEIARDFFGVTPEMATLHQANALILCNVTGGHDSMSLSMICLLAEQSTAPRIGI